MSVLSDPASGALFETLRSQPLCSGVEQGAISLGRNYLLDESSLDDFEFARDMLGDGPADVSEAPDHVDASSEWVEKWQAVAAKLKCWLDEPTSALDADDPDPDPSGVARQVG